MPELRSEMRRLILREGWKIETVARRFGVHHSVVRRALRDDLPAPGPAGVAPRASALDDFKPYVVERLIELPLLSGMRLHAELAERGCKVGIAQLRRYVAQVRPPRPRKVYLRVEFEPGEQAQVDWGLFGHMRVGSTQRNLSAFSMVLSWSRAIFVDFCFDQQMETFCRMHRRALEFFEGVPKRIVYDNLKSVVIDRVGNTIKWNPRFLGFCGHYLFEALAAPVRYPEFKGRVEDSIKYIRSSFFYGRSFSSLTDLRAQAAAWCRETANQRIHGTTRERPAERLLIERPRLRALPAHPFDTDLVVPVVISKEARVRFDANSYSVPPQHVGHTVHLRADDDTIRIVEAGAEVAHHPRCWDRHRHIEDPAHLEKLLSQRKAARGPKSRERLMVLCPEARAYLHEVARRKIHLSHEVDKLLRLVDTYDVADVRAAIARAVAERSFGSRFVRAFCDQARFARGQPEPPEPIVTGNPAADEVSVTPHPMESYDALFERKPTLSPPADPKPDGDK
jgi:transposase